MEYEVGKIYRFTIKSEEEILESGYGLKSNSNNYIPYGWNEEMAKLAGKTFDFVCRLNSENRSIFKNQSIPFSWCPPMLKSPNKVFNILNNL